jgi:hypothetical protein
MSSTRTKKKILVVVKPIKVTVNGNPKEEGFNLSLEDFIEPKDDIGCIEEQLRVIIT